MSADLLLYAIVAAGLVFWLRSVLGTRHGGERDRPNPFANPPGEGKDSAKPANTPALAGAQNLLPAADAAEDLNRQLGRGMSIADKTAESGLLEILRSDRAFDLGHFMTGAQDAFVMIVEAFAAGDRETLKDLLSPALYTAFEKAITARDARGEKASMEIHAVRKSDIMAARVQDKTAYITVRFTADETSVTRDGNDKIISGNPDRVSETIDIWTFGRSLRSRDPAWFVYETRAAAEDISPGSNVPAS